MTLRTLAAAAGLSICTATAGLAATVPVTVDGIDYDITTITGSFNTLSDELTAQIWWDDRFLASKFSLALAGGLGFPNELLSQPVSPIFASSEGSNIGLILLAGTTPTRSFQSTGEGGTTVRTFAIVAPISAVPLPAGGLLLLTAFGGFAALKRRKKRAA